MNSSLNSCYMDETLENSQSRQRKFSSYFKNEINSKLKNMNIQEDSSNWSESIKKSIHTNKLQQQAQDITDLLQSSCLQNDLHSLKDFLKRSDKQKNENDTNVCVKPLFEISELNQNGLYQEESNILSPKSTVVKESMVIQFKKLISQDNEQLELKKQPSTLNKKMNSSNRNLRQNDKLMALSKVSIQSLLKMRIYLMRFFKSYTISGRSKYLNKTIRRVINDQSDVISVQDGYSSFQVVKFCRTFYCKYFTEYSIPLINPQSLFGFIVKLSTTLINCFILFVFSLSITFQQHYQNDSKLSQYVSIIWLVDMMIQINTAPFYLQIHKSDRKSIVTKYIKQNAIFDVVPLIFVNTNSSNIIICIISNMLVFLKIINISRDLSYVQKRICMMVKRYYIIQMINLIIELFMIGHFVACIWYLIAQIELNILHKDRTWLDDTEDSSSWWHFYIWALYWALTLMTTGSNTANTILQASFTTFTLLFTTICFGYFLNAIGVILQEMDERLLQKRKDMNIINDYMREKNISKQLTLNYSLFSIQDFQFHFNSVLTPHVEAVYYFLEFDLYQRNPKEVFI